MATHHADFVLLDLIMPDVSGSEILADIFRIAPRARVVIVSGYSEDDVADLLAEIPHAQFLQKPYAPAALVNAIERALEPPIRFESATFQAATRPCSSWAPHRAPFRRNCATLRVCGLARHLGWSF